MNSDKLDQINGILLGTALGDSIGLPAEGLSRRRIQKMYKGQWRQSFLFNKGMCSDDTEHTIFVAQSLIAHSDDVNRFRSSLAWKLKLWFLGLPAGIGLATAKSILKLWLGFSPRKSGVFSAGNGPAMRSAIIGAVFHGQRDKVEAFVQASTEITHSDPKAYVGALAVALATSQIIENKVLNAQELITELSEIKDADSEWLHYLKVLGDEIEKKSDMESFLKKLNLEKAVTGYIYHSVIVALYGILLHPNDFKRAISEICDAGGDTDTVAAIAGAMHGASLGEKNLPKDWLKGLWEWPRGTVMIKKVGFALTQPGNQSVRYFWPSLILRNALFLIVVLLHGFRRALPPY